MGNRDKLEWYLQIDTSYGRNAVGYPSCCCCASIGLQNELFQLSKCVIKWDAGEHSWEMYSFDKRQTHFFFFFLFFSKSNKELLCAIRKRHMTACTMYKWRHRGLSVERRKRVTSVPYCYRLLLITATPCELKQTPNRRSSLQAKYLFLQSQRWTSLKAVRWPQGPPLLVLLVSQARSRGSLRLCIDYRDLSLRGCEVHATYPYAERSLSSLIGIQHLSQRNKRCQRKKNRVHFSR